MDCLSSIWTKALDLPSHLCWIFCHILFLILDLIGSSANCFHCFCISSSTDFLFSRHCFSSGNSSSVRSLLINLFRLSIFVSISILLFANWCYIYKYTAAWLIPTINNDFIWKKRKFSWFTLQFHFFLFLFHFSSYRTMASVGCCRCNSLDNRRFAVFICTGWNGGRKKH